MAAPVERGIGKGQELRIGRLRDLMITFDAVALCGGSLDELAVAGRLIIARGSSGHRGRDQLPYFSHAVAGVADQLASDVGILIGVPSPVTDSASELAPAASAEDTASLAQVTARPPHARAELRHRFRYPPAALSTEGGRLGRQRNSRGYGHAKGVAECANGGASFHGMTGPESVSRLSGRQH